MSFFLFSKQIVDVLYQWHLLDYLLVFLAVIALIYQLGLIRPKMAEAICLSDIYVGVLSLLVIGCYFRSFQPASGSWTDEYGIFVKVQSAFLIYCLGRLYYLRILECERALSSSAYIVVYAGFLYRLVQYGYRIMDSYSVAGDLYYYDTDMAYGMLVAWIFIVMYGRNSIWKLITMFMIVPLLVTRSCASTQKYILILLFVVLFFYLAEKIGIPRKLTNIFLGVSMIGTLIGVLEIVISLGRKGTSIVLLGLGKIGLLGQIVAVKNSDFSGVLHIWKRLSWVEKAVGTTFLTQNESSQYIQVLYSVGVLGSIVALLFLGSIILKLFQADDRKTVYVAVMLGVLFLGSGINSHVMESSQMSWFPMMFAGMVVSSRRLQT